MTHPATATFHEHLPFPTGLGAFGSDPAGEAAALYTTMNWKIGNLVVAVVLVPVGAAEAGAVASAHGFARITGIAVFGAGEVAAQYYEVPVPLNPASVLTLRAAANRLAAAPRDIALGLKTIDGAESLGPFGARRGASTSDDWARLGLHNAPEGRFDIAFQQTLDNITGNGGRIKFNLDSINVKNALGGNPLERIDRYTEWELQQIVRNKGWFNATDFYLNGQKLSLEQLLELGIKLH